MTGGTVSKALIFSLALVSAASIISADENLILLDMHPSTPHIQWLQKLNGNRDLAHPHRQLTEETLQRALDHIKGHSAVYARYFEFPMDIILPSGDDTEIDYHNRLLKKSLQQYNDVLNEHCESFSDERALKEWKSMSLTNITITIETITIPYSNSISFLNGTKCLDTCKVLPVLASGEHQLKCSKLDDVCKTFSACLKGNEVDTANLIEACRAHLIFMKSGGSSLRLVAKDLESNLQKTEKPYRKSPEQGKTLSSLLESERDSGIHRGNVLKEQSAAMGLLWIRRSLAFQLELYASLIDKNGPHPRVAASEAYTKHLSPFHGWTLRKVFPASLSLIPDRKTLIAMFAGLTLDELNEEHDREVVEKLKYLVAELTPLINTWERDFARLDLEDIRRV